MNIYTRKQRWKLILLGIAAVIVLASLWFTNQLVRKIAEDERQKVSLWAEAVQKRANLVQYTDAFFEKIRLEERKRVELWAEATRRAIVAENDEDLGFYSLIITSNTTIPVILTDNKGNIITSSNLAPEFKKNRHFTGAIKEAFSKYPPIKVTFESEPQYIYYQDSWLFTELREVLDDLIESLINEIVVNSANVPVIITDSTASKIISFGGIDENLLEDSMEVNHTIYDLKSKNQPIEIVLPNHGKCIVYYSNSYLLTQLRYYPILQLIIIGLFLLVSYILFSTSRNIEQNQVWVGMSKETAHQLGTPLSSLMGWMELLKYQNVDDDTIAEMNKDIKRLQNVTERFSKIGSTPKLIEVDINSVLNDCLSYIKTRTSNQVQFSTHFHNQNPIIIPLNTDLFEWVIENLIKNAVDAMEGKGTLTIDLVDNDKWVIIDISDTGKGIPKGRFKTIFNPGFTSKQRGWGLGLSLSKRIIKNYHKGRIFVKSSVVNSGTTFRIMLKK